MVKGLDGKTKEKAEVPGFVQPREDTPVALWQPAAPSCSSTGAVGMDRLPRAVAQPQADGVQRVFGQHSHA